MLTKEKLLTMKPAREPVEVSVPGWPDKVLLRYPTFAEWHKIIAEVRSSGGKETPAEHVASTIGVCLAEPDGSRMLSDREALQLLRQDHEAVMSVYVKCWETVLKSDGKMEEAEKKLLEGNPLREFLLRIALEIGEWDVDTLAARMPMNQFWEWAAFFRISPWGDSWRQTARLMTGVLASAGGKVDSTTEDKLMPGGGKFRGMSQTELEMLEQLRKIDGVAQQVDGRR